MNRHTRLKKDVWEKVGAFTEKETDSPKVV